MKTQTGSKMAVNLLVLLMLVVAEQRTDGTCTFPSDLRGTWKSSRWGDITFTSTQLTVTLLVIGSTDLQCETQSGTLYVLRSTTSISVLSNTVDVVACLDLHRQSSVKYMYYHGTSDVPFTATDKEPVTLVAPASTVNTSIACDIPQPYHIGTNDMMIEVGSEVSVASQCPNPFLGTFDNYTIDNGAGAQCGGVGYFTDCDNYKNITVDYSVCSETMFYSSGGSLVCLYSSTNGSTYYVNLYNFDATVDDSSTFRFSCVAIQYGSDSSDYVYATQYPISCSEIQTATSVPSSPYQGGTIQMSPNVPTSTSSSSSNIGIIIAIILLLIIIILICVAVYHLWYRKRWPLVKEKLPCFKGKNQGQVDPQRDNKLSHFTTTTETKKRPLQSSQSSRSAATPSVLQPEIVDGEKAADPSTTSSAAAYTSPRPARLPPLETPAYSGESQHVVSVEPVFQPTVAPAEITRITEESVPSAAEYTQPHVYNNDPVYENM